MQVLPMVRGHTCLLRTVLPFILGQHQTARGHGHLFSTAVVFYIDSSCSQKSGTLPIFYSLLFITQVVEKFNTSHKTDSPYEIVLCTQESIIILFFWSSLSDLN